MDREDIRAEALEEGYSAGKLVAVREAIECGEVVPAQQLRDAEARIERLQPTARGEGDEDRQ